MNKSFDVIVVGGGHAGCEAAYAAARLGANTALVSLDTDKLATMPCNPSIGGLGKGHIVFEIAAFEGLMPKLCSQTYLQARMLNTSKGPAVQGLRLQIDKFAYSKQAKQILQNTQNLTIVHGTGLELLTQNHGDTKSVTGIKMADGSALHAPCVVFTTGTFLNGLIHIGLTRYKAGRRGEAAVYGLSESIASAMNVKLGRLKTGTPPRLKKETLNFEKMERQTATKLNYLFEFDEMVVEEKVPCFITETNSKTHEIIKNNLHLSALYSGNIKGTGPRYCPSIEDKIGRFADRMSHHVFIEPEGADSNEIYPAGLSNSLPLSVQYEYIRSIKGLENAEITKCGYAIEYDFIQPNNLTHSLEAKTVQGLFLAGQINGTTGYEEAAGLGLIAGINAALKATNKPAFTLSRSESYIGVLIDDLVTLGVDEPYRMFTSRAERRLLLRQDNVFLRLMPHANKLGLIRSELYAKFLGEKEIIEKSVEYIKQQRPKEIFKLFDSIEFTEDIQQQAREKLVAWLHEKNLPTDALSCRALLCLHAQIRYSGYIEREQFEVEKMKRYLELEISPSTSYTGIPGLTRELQVKLTHYKPQTIAQAMLIPGMTPAAISVLIFQMRMKFANN